ncbi:MAG TPA: hypothetical protein VKZ44_00670 [Taishania sp.]|nr:hypothetical protein [Taishania sp.]
MKHLKDKPLLIFILLVIIVTGSLVFIPFNIFPGEIILNISNQESVIEAPLTLGNLIGLGIDAGDLDNVVDYYLTPKGYMLAFIMCIGIPGLVAYRFHVNKNKKP